MLWLNQALPFRARVALAHLTKADDILSHIDAGQRAAYAARLERIAAAASRAQRRPGFRTRDWQGVTMNTKTTYRRVPTQTVDVDGSRFAYRNVGAETGVPVIFLHQFGANLDDWDPRVIDGIAARHPVIAFDNRGVGASTGRTPTTVEAMARDAGHGGAFQYHGEFVPEVLKLLGPLTSTTVPNGSLVRGLDAGATA